MAAGVFSRLPNIASFLGASVSGAANINEQQETGWPLTTARHMPL